MNGKNLRWNIICQSWRSFSKILGIMIFMPKPEKKIACFFLNKISGVSNSRGNLNNNLYFLLLGLGVDDAFVLTSEYLTHSREAKAKAGGVSSFSRGSQLLKDGFAS